LSWVQRLWKSGRPSTKWPRFSFAPPVHCSPVFGVARSRRSRISWSGTLDSRVSKHTYGSGNNFVHLPAQVNPITYWLRSSRGESPSSSRRSATGNCKQLAVGPPLGSRRRATKRNSVVPAASNIKEQNEKESHRHAGGAIGGLLRPFFQNFEWHGLGHCCAR